MTNEELVALIQDGENVSENMGLLYEQNKGMIYNTVKNYRSSVNEIDDLMQQAYIALDKAAREYDLSKGDYFAGDAKCHILNEIAQYAASNYSTSKYYRKLIIKYQQLVSDYEKEHGRQPTDQEVMDALNLGERAFNNFKDNLLSASILSLNAPLQDISESDNLEDMIADDNGDIEDDYIRKEQTEILKMIWGEVDSLKEDQREFIYEHYQKQKPMSKIAKEKGVKDFTIWHIQADALDNLRSSAKAKWIAYEGGFWSDSKAYRSGFRKFKEMGCSMTEYLALKSITHDENYIIAHIRELPDGKIKDVMQMIYIDGMMLKQIAAKFGVTSQSVLRYKKKGLRMIEEI